VLTAVVALLLGSLTLRCRAITCRWAPSPGASACTSCSAPGVPGRPQRHHRHPADQPVRLAGHGEIYYLIWAFVLAAVLTTQPARLPRGRAIRALKGGMVMAEAMGVDTSRSRMVIFVIAALHACAAGWLYAHMQRFVNPTPFGLHIGIEYLFMAVVGGAGHVWARWWAPGHHRAQAVAAGHPAQAVRPAPATSR
jgi:branched-chain amino acid transport system permease protein